MEVSRIIVHESYKRPYGMAHDIALLKLKGSATINQQVSTVCLPSGANPPAEHKKCWITGAEYAERITSDAE